MISLIALKRLGLDEVWWLVSPQNPLKPVSGMAPLAERVGSARIIADHRRIKVSDIEARIGTHFTRDTLKRLTQRRRRYNFVWLMGADNLIQFPKWQGWQEIFKIVPIAVFDRPSYSFRGLAGVAATRYASYRMPERYALGLSRRSPPAWVFLHSRLNPVSATQIRSRDNVNE
ncbi:MAG: nicotinate-nucleotide adenylyltransferase [Alphaproteobacteria bacterium MarineAlpha4_Bin2]|nr:MAG: nicotinate-nucleotide adenylyltransferase [Alphaproteobacteria bacterium MarineAlpha4_Bin2]